MKYLFVVFCLVPVMASAAVKTWNAECEFHYRKSLSVTPNHVKTVELSFDDSGDESASEPTEFPAGVFMVSVAEGSALTVTTSHSGKNLHHGLWQTVKNLDQNHGITGLQYVSGPKGEELQYFCKVK